MRSYKSALLTVLLAAVAVDTRSQTVPEMGQTPSEVMDLLAAAHRCDRLETAAGRVKAYVLHGTGGRLAMSFIVDLKRRRLVARSIFEPSDGVGTKQAKGYASLDGERFYCRGTNVETCEWKEGLPPDIEGNGAATTNTDYVEFEDYLTPDAGGAELQLLPLDRSVEGSEWTVRVTPPSGAPVVWHIGSDGLLLAQDSDIRITNKSWQTVEGCKFPLLMEASDSTRPDLSANGTMTVVEFKDTMALAETAITVNGEQR